MPRSTRGIPAGRVVGINTAILSPSGQSVGIGFALPSATAKAVVDDLMHFGEVHRGWLGVDVQPLTSDLARQLHVQSMKKGVVVSNVTKFGPAQEAGLRAGDVITRFDEKPVRQVRDLLRFIAETRVRKRVEVAFLRDGKSQTVWLTVGELQRDDSDTGEPAADEKEKKTDLRPALPVGSLGLSLSSLTPDVRSMHRIPVRVKGVMVMEAATGSAAAGQGIRAGDVIVEANRQAVTEPEDVERAISEVRKRNDGSKLLLRVYTKGHTRFFAIDVGQS